MTATGLRRALAAFVVTSAAAVVAPAPAHAGDCGADYVTCLATYTDYVSSDWFHDTQCSADYFACLKRLMLLF